MEYHGIIVAESLKDKSILQKLNVIGRSKGRDWTLCKISVPGKDLERTLEMLRANMADGFYFHFYGGDELIAVFKKRTFRVKTDKSTWKELLDYGKKLGIPEKQLDFSPCRFEDEIY
ncbi:MAG: hypothetical protein QXD77_00775 [Candidatus Aenigmatarchaeota archaeon]